MTVATLPTFTWRKSAFFTRSANTDLDQFTTLYNAFLTGTYWGVNHYTGTAPRRLELKRIGSPPPGELSTARILFTNGSTPANAGLQVTPGNTSNLYMTLSTDADTGASGPPTLYTTGSPYGANGNTLARGINTPSAMSLTTGGGVWFAESTEGVFIVLRGGDPASSTVCATAFAGRFWDDGTTTPKWCAGWSGGGITGTGPFASSAFMVADCYSNDSSSTAMMLGVAPGTSVRTRLGRASEVPFCAQGQDGSALYHSQYPLLHDVVLGGRVYGSGDPYAYAGRLRQIKFGQFRPDRTEDRDSIFVGSGGNANRNGVHLDQQS